MEKLKLSLERTNPKKIIVGLAAVGLGLAFLSGCSDYKQFEETQDTYRIAERQTIVARDGNDSIYGAMQKQVTRVPTNTRTR